MKILMFSKKKKKKRQLRKPICSCSKTDAEVWAHNTSQKNKRSKMMLASLTMTNRRVPSHRRWFSWLLKRNMCSRRLVGLKQCGQNKNSYVHQIIDTMARRQRGETRGSCESQMITGVFLSSRDAFESLIDHRAAREWCGRTLDHTGIHQ